MTQLSPFAQPGRFWRGNLHTHSTWSDGALSPETVAQVYIDAGYDFLMLSEHFINHYNSPIVDTRSLRSNQFTTIIGAELHAPNTSVGELWHIVAAGLPLDFTPCQKGETGVDIARRAAAAGAFVGIAHPAWSQLTIEDGRSIDIAHAVEIYNHGCAIETDRGDGWYLLDQLLNDGKKLTGFAADDAHFHHHDSDAFGGWVQVKARSADPEELLEALKLGHYYSSQGPQIHSISISGKELEISCSPVDTVTVAGGTSRSVRKVGRAITTTTLDLRGLEKGFVVPNPSPWLRVTIIDNAGKRAWSNPIWLDEI
ncbi:MAG: CehA/McbA family metallohydrolase [Desulfobulbaceae bacterium]|nr:CehA/McbA family metallohydrolase [Desulfobulbaceae bacterium]